MKRIGSLPILLCACLCGCIGVVPLRQRTVTPGGPSEKIDLSFLKPGHTTRAEVMEKLESTSVGLESDHFFVGRWRTSKAGAWLAGGTPAGYGGFAADRIWRNVNLLVKFDGNSVLENYEIFPDKELVAKLAPVAQEKKLSEKEQLDASITVNSDEIPVDIVLLPKSLEIAESKNFAYLKHERRYDYTVPRENLQHVSVNRYQTNVEYIDITIHFVSDLRQFQGPRGKNVSLQMSIPELTKLLAYASHHQLEDPPAQSR